MPIDATAIYVARGMLRSGSRVSSPYSAADSKPTKLNIANISAMPSEPLVTTDGSNDWVGNADAPFYATTITSNTMSTRNSSTINVPSTFADRSTDR